VAGPSRISSGPRRLSARNAVSAPRPELPIINFNFADEIDENTRQSLSSAQREGFKADFARELKTISAWARQHWFPLRRFALQVFVSGTYKISKALVPAWSGQRGRMEFPAWRLNAGNPAIMHELTHVFFPNGNRFLAEGFAVHLQAAIGGNPAFPNFGRPLHASARERLTQMLPGFADGANASLAPLHLGDLDSIATPSPLVLAIGSDSYGEDANGQACIYPIAGSFVEFLIASRGMTKFCTLYRRTPLRQHQLAAGLVQRWSEVYGSSLGELEMEWRSFIVNGSQS